MLQCNFMVVNKTKESFFYRATAPIPLSAVAVCGLLGFLGTNDGQKLAINTIGKVLAMPEDRGDIQPYETRLAIHQDIEGTRIGNYAQSKINGYERACNNTRLAKWCNDVGITFVMPDEKTFLESYDPLHHKTPVASINGMKGDNPQYQDLVDLMEFEKNCGTEANLIIRPDENEAFKVFIGNNKSTYPTLYKYTHPEEYKHDFSQPPFSQVNNQLVEQGITLSNKKKLLIYTAIDHELTNAVSPFKNEEQSLVAKSSPLVSH